MNAIGTDKLACKEVIPALSIGSRRIAGKPGCHCGQKSASGKFAEAD